MASAAFCVSHESLVQKPQFRGGELDPTSQVEKWQRILNSPWFTLHNKANIWKSHLREAVMW